MATVRYSNPAKTDLLSIGRYTIQQWGVEQASRYLSQIEERLAETPVIGRACNDIRPGLRRMEQGRHVIFYRQRPRGILVVRVLHQRMLPGPQLAG